MTLKSLAQAALLATSFIVCIQSGLCKNVGIIKVPTGIEMTPCNNAIVKSIPGNFSAVLEVGRQYVEMLNNDTLLEPFGGRWKWEPERVLSTRPSVPECSTLRVFGDERRNYDEAKRFCFFGDQKLMPSRRRLRENRRLTEEQLQQNSSVCSAYSIGSNNKWEFEEEFYRSTKCIMDTFDCTCNVTIPQGIIFRTRFWPHCIGQTDSPDGKFLTFPSLNRAAGRHEGPDYLKVDIEGYEWGILRAMAQLALSDRSIHKHLPLQIYGEFHLDRDSTEDNRYISLGGNNAYVGKKLRNFFDDLFIKAGYMIMHRRTTLQTRNSDMLLVKVFCPADTEQLNEAQLG